MYISPTFREQGWSNQVARLLWPLVATALSDITECMSLLLP
jgi:hypothetical protein